MAERITRLLIDDLDGEREADEQVAFALDGTRYAIDLAADNATALRDALAPFIAAGRKVGRVGAGRVPRSTGSRNLRSDTTEVREWARQHGHKVSDRGRIPADVQRAYDEAHRATGSTSSTGKRRKADKSSSTSSTSSASSIGSQESEPVPA